MREGVLVVRSVLLSFVLLCPARPVFAGKAGVDTTPPQLNLTAPLDQQRTSVASIRVSGQATDNVAVASTTLSLNGAPAVSLTLDRSGNFQTTAQLALGTTVITVKAADRAGNVVSVARTVVYEASALEITSPREGAVINAGSVDLLGTREKTITRVAAGFLAADLSEGGFAIGRVALKAGLNTITVVGVDAAGNRKEATVSVTSTSTQEPFSFTADPKVGSPPLRVAFSLAQNVSGTPKSFEIDYQGNGSFVPVSNGGAGLAYDYQTEGTVYPTVRVLMTDGTRFTQYLTLSVYKPARLVASLMADDPAALAVDAKGRLFVLERSANRVRVFDSKGIETGSFGSAGIAAGQFSSPSGLALDSAGNVYVADTGNNRVQKFSATFAHLMTIGSLGALLGQLNQPRGIAVASGGDIYVTEGGNHRVQQFDSRGNSVRAWDPALFTDPWGIAIVGEGALVVADHGNGGLLSFTESGMQTAWEDAPRALTGPAGVAADRNRSGILVADQTGNRLVALSSEGTLLREISAIEGDTLGLSAPLAVVRKPHPVEEQYYVADTGHGRVLTISVAGSGAAGPIEAAWSGMKTSLFAGNVEDALLYFSEESRDKYRDIFTKVGSRLANAQQSASGKLLPLRVDEDEAEYGLIVPRDGRQVMYRVHFVRDERGAWKIYRW